MIYLQMILFAAALVSIISVVFEFKIDSFQRRLSDAEKEIEELKDRIGELEFSQFETHVTGNLIVIPEKENGDEL